MISPHGPPAAAQVPLLIGTSVAKAVAALRARQDPADASANGGDGAAGPSRPAPVTLDWRSLSCRLSNEKTGASKQLLFLDGGSAVPGNLLAIMGPSGSGATGAHKRPYQSNLFALTVEHATSAPWHDKVSDECTPSIPVQMLTRTQDDCSVGQQASLSQLRYEHSLKGIR